MHFLWDRLNDLPEVREPGHDSDLHFFPSPPPQLHLDCFVAGPAFELVLTCVYLRKATGKKKKKAEQRGPPLPEGLPRGQSPPDSSVLDRAGCSGR
jgi:hypothetical protein